MYRRSCVPLAVFLGFVAGPLVAQAMTGEQVLKASDDKLLPPNCSYTMTLDTEEDDGTKKVNVLEGFKKGNTRNVMIVQQPSKVRGSVHMRKELVIWSYYTTDRKLIKEAYASTFMGSLLNYGDVMATELSYDYAVSEMRATAESYILTLGLRPGHEGYARVVMVVDKASLEPRKREYYARSGELMKTCDIMRLDRSGDKTVYLQQKYYEPLKRRYSTAEYREIEYVDASSIPESYFNENRIRFLSGQ